MPTDGAPFQDLADASLGAQTWTAPTPDLLAAAAQAKSLPTHASELVAKVSARVLGLDDSLVTQTIDLVTGHDYGPLYAKRAALLEEQGRLEFACDTLAVQLSGGYWDGSSATDRLASLRDRCDALAAAAQELATDVQADDLISRFVDTAGRIIEELARLVGLAVGGAARGLAAGLGAEGLALVALALWAWKEG